MRFKFSLKNSTIFLRFIWFLCSGVFRWCYVVAPLVFRGVQLVFWGVPLFHHCSGVFHRSTGVPCFVVPCSGVPGFIVCHTFEEYCVWKGQATKEEVCKSNSTFLALSNWFKGWWTRVWAAKLFVPLPYYLISS